MELAFSEYIDHLQRRAIRAGAPVSCTFEITPTCNLRCHFCYVALDPYTGPYLSTEQMITVLDVLKEAGVLMLTLTGGEIFSRRDFGEIYRAAHERGFLITLFTNATMVNEAHAHLLRELPPFGVEVSIYGADAEHYERTTGISGSFARFERGVQLLMSAGTSPLIKHPVTTLTGDDAQIDAIRDWCTVRGLRHKFTTDIERRHDGGDEPTMYRIESRTAREVKDRLHVIRTGVERSLPMAECAAVDDQETASKRLYQCGAGRRSLFVDALGNASHCVLDREPNFPLLTMPWPEIWTAMQAWVNQPLPEDAPCSGCGLRSGCNNCPARSRLATGSPYLKDPYQCEMTHAEYGIEQGVTVTAARPLGACVA